MLMMFCIMFFCGLSVFSSKRKQLLMTLLSLEFIVLVLFIYYFMLLCNNNKWSIMYNNIFLSFAVCEGVLGLSILVSMILPHGNDYFNLFGLLQCKIMFLYIYMIPLCFITSGWCMIQNLLFLVYLLFLVNLDFFVRGI